MTVLQQMGRFGVTLATLGLTIVLAAAAPAAGQEAAAGPTLEIDVQVIDRDGLPIAGITPDKFNIEVDGRRRRVISAEQVDGSQAEAAGPLEGRSVYFVAIDASTFGPSSSADAVEAVTTFIGTLPEGSLVGLVTFPGGPSMELTTDHASVGAAVASLAGQRQPLLSGSFGLGIGDAMEFLSSNDQTEVARRYCGAELSEDNACPQLLEQEASTAINGLEAHARYSLGVLTDFSTRLGQIPGRKVLVLVSAGLAVAQRSGGRPDVGNLPAQLAEAVTGSDIAFYTLLLDGLQDTDASQGGRSSNGSRDREALSRWFDQFSLANGGALFRVQSGEQTDAYGRIALETASYYKVTLESTDGDVGERPQRLRVRVDERDSTVRARTLVKGR